jgi:HAD superfamily hydrolase (TIGR01458 family)
MVVAIPSPMGNAVMLDIDGVLIVSWEPLPGAIEAVEWLQGHGIDFRLVTNTSSKPRREIARRLSESGIRVDVDQVLTAVTSAAHYLAEHHPGARCLVINEGDLREDLEGVTFAGAASADVVVLGGAGPTVGYAELDAAFKLAIDGAPVIALHRNTRYQTADGPALDMGAYVVGLEAAAGIEIMVVGKPAAAFYRAALADLDVEAEGTAMVGDDLVSDVLGAQAVGMTGVLVRTGKFRPSDLDDAPGRPDLMIDDIGQLPGLLEHLARPR